MRPGPRPKPTFLFELHGRPNKGRRLNKAEPKPVGDLATAPEPLSDDQENGWDTAARQCPAGIAEAPRPRCACRLVRRSGSAPASRRRIEETVQNLGGGQAVLRNGRRAQRSATA